jgi:signal peptidase I
MADAAPVSRATPPDAHVLALNAWFILHPEQLGRAAQLLAGEGRAVDITIHGRSMGDALPDGASAKVEFVTAGECNQGDVIIFRQRHQLVVHRIVRLLTGAQPYLFITRGDARFAPDPPVSGESVLGRVVSVAGVSVRPNPLTKRRTIARHGIRLAESLVAGATKMAPGFGARASAFLQAFERSELVAHCVRSAASP